MMAPNPFSHIFPSRPRKKSCLSLPRLWAKDPGCTWWCKWEKVHESCGGSKRRCECFVYFFIFHLLTNSYPSLLYYSYWQGKHKTPTISGGSHQAAACHSRVWACHARVDGAICCLGDVICSSGNTRPYLGSCRPTLIFPFCHHGRAINATTGTTSKYPHLSWIFHSSISFSQLNKLSVLQATHLSHHHTA